MIVHVHEFNNEIINAEFFFYDATKKKEVPLRSAERREMNWKDLISGTTPTKWEGVVHDWEDNPIKGEGLHYRVEID